ncbi:MAG: metal ABC transporter solute-binding protein, Zn/Mn family [Holosporales bacterium]
MSKGRWLRYVWLLWACLAGAQASEKLRVVASFSILQDWVAEVGGEHITVQALVGPNSDAHVFQPTPDSVKQIQQADVVFAIGLQFETWMPRLLEASASEGAVIVLADHIDYQHQRVERQGKFMPDPHVWHDIGFAKMAVALIRDTLVAKDPRHKKDYEKRAKAYIGRLKKLEAWVREEIAYVPEIKRQVVTAHDAFGYFSRAYGVEFSAPQGISTETEPSAQQVAALIREINEEGIRAVFIENMANANLVRQIADETGTDVLGKLYSDALSNEDEPAPTYVQMMRHNVATLVRGMHQNRG